MQLRDEARLVKLFNEAIERDMTAKQPALTWISILDGTDDVDVLERAIIHFRVQYTHACGVYINLLKQSDKLVNQVKGAVLQDISARMANAVKKAR